MLVYIAHERRTIASALYFFFARIATCNLDEISRPVSFLVWTHINEQSTFVVTTHHPRYHNYDNTHHTQDTENLL